MGEGMHTVFFALKRGYQAPVRRFNRMLGDYGLTWARFDLLFKLRGIGRWQSQVWRELGVSREAVELYLASDVIDLHVDAFIWERIFGKRVVERQRGLRPGIERSWLESMGYRFWPLELTEKSFDREMLQSVVPAVARFWAPWT